MVECERCGEECKRRKLCHHCSHLVCGWCWHHECECMPGHRPEHCIQLNAIKKKGRAWFLTKVVSRQRKMAELPPLPRYILAPFVTASAVSETGRRLVIGPIRGAPPRQIARPACAEAECGV